MRGCPPCPEGLLEHGVLLGEEGAISSVWSMETPVFPSRDGEAPAPRFSFWWEGGRTPEAAVGGEASGTGEAQEFPRWEPPTTAKAGEAGAGLDRGGGD